MSRSRREFPAPEAAPRKGLRAIFKNGQGRLRGGWVLAGALLAYIAASLAVRLGLTALFNALFGAWNVNAQTASRAPGWARALYAWHGTLVTLAVAAAIIALSPALGRRLGVCPRRDARGARPALVCALAGLGGAALTAALFLAIDSLRPEWPLGRPNLTPGLVPLLAISLCSALAGELFSKRVLFDGFRGRWGAAWAALLPVAFFFFDSGGIAGNAVSALNVLLLGALCCAIYDRYGLWAGVALRWGWSAGTVFLLGQGGGAHAVYRLYGVSERLLTGGDAGFAYGLWTTLMLAAALAALALPRLRALTSPLRQGKRMTAPGRA